LHLYTQPGRIIDVIRLVSVSEVVVNICSFFYIAFTVYGTPPSLQRFIISFAIHHANKSYVDQLPQPRFRHRRFKFLEKVVVLLTLTAFALSYYVIIRSSVAFSSSIGLSTTKGQEMSDFSFFFFVIFVVTEADLSELKEHGVGFLLSYLLTHFLGGWLLNWIVEALDLGDISTTIIEMAVPVGVVIRVIAEIVT